MESRYSQSGYDITPLSREQVWQLAAELDPEAYRITQESGTEPAFCGNLLDNKQEGIYCCVVCGLPLFSSEHKFMSGTGWPSFWRGFDPEHVTRKIDRSAGMVRTEINCARCGAHLGHVFDDGPAPTGERHCLNSAALKFYAKGEMLPPESRPTRPTTSEPVGSGPVASDPVANDPPARHPPARVEAQSQPAARSQPAGTETAYFAGGCFWGIEHYFQQGPGVIDAVSGFMQGHVKRPTYEQVCTDRTGHAETVKVVYDPRRITYRRLLEAFFKMHNPTELNRQRPDVGSQYRSGIWYNSEQQRREAEAYIAELEARHAFGGRKIVTQVEPAKTFWPAEGYHQDYIEKTGQVCHVADPW